MTNSMASAAFNKSPVPKPEAERNPRAPSLQLPLRSGFALAVGCFFGRENPIERMIHQVFRSYNYGTQRGMKIQK